MLLDFLPEGKKKILLGFGFIEEAYSEYKASRLTGKLLTKFLDNISKNFKKQLVPSILTEEEFEILIVRASNLSFDELWKKRFKISGNVGGTYKTITPIQQNRR